MDIDRRALYNSLRMNWLIDPSLEVDDWQVENYRDMSMPLLCSRLREFGLDFDKDSFCSIAEGYDTPEELTESLIDQEQVTPEIEDRIYLLVFELWRRLETGKPCLSVFCDELDHQIFLYDRQQAQEVEEIQDVLSNLQVILDENTDQGADPIEVLHSINKGCANDIETFLYDFITEQVDNHNFSYASELLDGFIDYVDDDKWFELLRVRALTDSDPESAAILVQQLAEEATLENDLQFNLELLSEMVQDGDVDSFRELVIQTSQLLEREEDFQDLLTVCLDYYSCQDQEEEEHQILMIIDNRSKNTISNPFSKEDQDLESLLSVVNRT
ncbi:MAG: hypothetical protein AAGG81_05720 [Chlamydiota bacterium]